MCPGCVGLARGERAGDGERIFFSFFSVITDNEGTAGSTWGLLESGLIPMVSVVFVVDAGGGGMFSRRNELEDLLRGS